MLSPQAAGAALEGGSVEPRLLLDTTDLADFVDPGPLFETVGDVAFFYLWELHHDDNASSAFEELTIRLALWRTDGSPEGTFSLTPEGSSFFYYSDVLNGVLYFALCEPDQPLFFYGSLCDSPANVHLWRTDGTAEGTFRLLEDGARSLGWMGLNTQAVADLGLFFFTTFSEVPGYELWATDGTRDGTRLVTNLSARGFSNPYRLESSGDALYFQVNETAMLSRAWLGRSDGTAEGTELMLAPFEGEMRIVDLERSRDRIYLLGRGPEARRPPLSPPFGQRMTLWSIDDGLELRFLGDLGYEQLDRSPLMTTESRRAFVRFHREDGLILWGSDGTEGGAELLAEAPVRTFVSLFVWLDALAVPQGSGFFAQADDDHGIEPWITDGTVDGTKRLADLCPGECDSNPRGHGLGPGGSFVFSADDGLHGREPWSWRPAQGSLERIGDLCPGECPATTWWIGPLEDRVFLVSTIPGGIQTVWSLDPVRKSEPIAVADLTGIQVQEHVVLFVPQPVQWTIRGDDWTFWGATPDCPLCLWTLPLDSAPPPPAGPPLTSEHLPGYAVKVRIGGQDGISGQAEPACIPETLCVSGALAGRSEVFVRVVGPKPNGKLWPTLVKFTTSTVEVWIEQLATGLVRYYRLEGASPGSSELPGLFDRDGFPPG